MKLRLYVIAEFDVNPEHYDEPTPECVLATEEQNLEEESIYNYLPVFDERNIYARMEVIS